MKWIIKLVVEITHAQTVEHEIATVEREDLLAPATVGLSIAEGKLILENLQKQMIVAKRMKKQQMRWNRHTDHPTTLHALVLQWQLVWHEVPPSDLVLHWSRWPRRHQA